MLPKNKEIKLPLLSEIKARGGSTKPSTKNSIGQNVYESLAEYFDISKDDLAKVTKGNRSKWNNRVRWARNDLKDSELLTDQSSWGVWKITEAGRKQALEFEKEISSSSDFVAEQEISYQDFLKNLESMKDLGEKGEFFVLKIEKVRLISNGRKDLASKVEHKAKINVAAGFDILSFENNGTERYIEVKSTNNEYSGFRITRNELEKANQLGNKYWIYYLIFNEKEEVEIKKFRDPSKLIKEGKFKTIPTEFLVVETEK